MKKVDRQTGARKGEGSDNDVPAKRQKIFGSKNSFPSGEDEEGQTDIDKEVEGEGMNETPGSSKGRKNIRKLIKVKDLHVTTQEAAKEEEVRKQRLAERQKLHNQIFKPSESDKLESLVLDFNTDTKKAVVSVDPAIVAQLKPHQAKGIKFMWDNCFESLEEQASGGCILAHCMGLGKTLQSVAFVHTLITHPETGVKTVLVICPLTTANNWCNEFRKWTKKASGKVRVHRLWEKKGDESYESLELWHKDGGVGILHYERFRSLINSEHKKGRFKIQRKFLQIIQDTLVDPGPDLVICDEGHLLKNPNSRKSKAVNKVKTQRRIILTGTPMQNNLLEYHSTMSIVKPNLLGDINEFRNRFMNPIENGQHKDSSAYDVDLMKKRSHVLHQLLESCVQRLDYNVLTPFLPPKHEYTICINLTEKQKDLYDHFIKNFSARSQVESVVRSKFFTDYTILHKICTHPKALLTCKTKIDSSRGKTSGSEPSSKKLNLDHKNSDDGTTSSEPGSLSSDESDEDREEDSEYPVTAKERINVVDDEDEDIEDAGDHGKDGNDSKTWYKQFFKNDLEMSEIELGAKFRVLMEILRVAEDVGDKVLIFSQYLTTLDLVEDFFAEVDRKVTTETAGSARGSEGRYQPGIDYFRIDGSTKSSTRQDQCDKFNKNSTAKVFLISVKAGGLGINLQGANRVVIFDASWNPAQDLQAIFRVYRFGQTKPSYVYRLLARGTMEEKVYNRQLVKLSLSCRVVDEQQTERHFDYEDLQKIYHFDRNDPTERPIPILPKDKLMVGLLKSHHDSIFSYLEHDSLLENNEEEELTDEAKKLAWEEFNNEATFEKCFADGNGDWCFYTMKRLRQLHPLEDIAVLEATVKDLIRIFRQLLSKYRELTQLPAKMPIGTPDAKIVAVEHFKNYTKEICGTYKNQLNFQDISYLSKAWIELLRLSLNFTTCTEATEGPIIELKSDVGNGNGTCVDVVRDCMSVIRHIGGTPFTRFRIEADGDCDPDEWRTAFAEFIELVGSSTTFLSLYWQPEKKSSMLSIAELRRLIFQQMPSLTTLHIRPYNYLGFDKKDAQRLLESIPNLQRIKLCSRFRGTTQLMRQFLTDVIEAAKNLEYISAKSRFESCRNSILPTLSQPSLRSRVNNLNILKIYIGSSTDLQNLLELGRQQNVSTLHLKELCLSEQCVRTSCLEERNKMTSAFYDILLTQAPSLRKLRLEFLRVVSLHPSQIDTRSHLWFEYASVFRLPLMTKLTSLKVARSETMKIDLEFEGRNLAATFPCLTRLVYRHQRYQYNIEADTNLDNDLRQISHHRVTELKVVTSTVNDLTRFEPTMYPVLTDFHVTVEPVDLPQWWSNQKKKESNPSLCEGRQVWGLWPALTKLHLCLKLDAELDLDELLTGIDRKEMTKVRKDLLNLKLLPSSSVSTSLVDLRRLVDKCKKKDKNPSRSIRDLNQLQEFTLEPQSGSKALTDVGVYLGLALTTKLKRITIHGPDLENNISDDCRGFLQTVLGPDAVINI